MKTDRRVYLLFAATVGMLILIGLFNAYLDTPTKKDQVTSFEQCVSAGNLILKSNPPQCRTPQGKLFVKKLQK